MATRKDVWLGVLGESCDITASQIRKKITGKVCLRFHHDWECIEDTVTYNENLIRFEGQNRSSQDVTTFLLWDDIHAVEVTLE